MRKFPFHRLPHRFTYLRCYTWKPLIVQVSITIPTRPRSYSHTVLLRILLFDSDINSQSGDHDRIWLKWEPHFHRSCNVHVVYHAYPETHISKKGHTCTSLGVASLNFKMWNVSRLILAFFLITINEPGLFFFYICSTQLLDCWSVTCSSYFGSDLVYTTFLYIVILWLNLYQMNMISSYLDTAMIVTSDRGRS